MTGREGRDPGQSAALKIPGRPGAREQWYRSGRFQCKKLSVDTAVLKGLMHLIKRVVLQIQMRRNQLC